MDCKGSKHCKGSIADKAFQTASGRRSWRRSVVVHEPKAGPRPGTCMWAAACTLLGPRPQEPSGRRWRILQTWAARSPRGTSWPAQQLALFHWLSYGSWACCPACHIVHSQRLMEKMLHGALRRSLRLSPAHPVGGAVGIAPSRHRCGTCPAHCAGWQTHNGARWQCSGSAKVSRCSVRKATSGATKCRPCRGRPRPQRPWSWFVCVVSSFLCHIVVRDI